MGASRSDVNYTNVFVVYKPPYSHERAIIQITIRPGLVQDDLEHIALQNVLAAVKQLQKAAL
jgi:hypothetical protein